VIETAFAGTVVNQVYDGNRTINIVALLPATERTNPQSVRKLPLRSANGQFIALEDVAQIYVATARSAIRHEGGQRMGVITSTQAHAPYSRSLAMCRRSCRVMRLSTAIPGLRWPAKPSSNSRLSAA
jgi:Cu/Ag efflux pump CusA